MFTGIVEGMGTVAAVEEQVDGRHLVIQTPPLAAGLGIGASVSVNGACLTVVAAGEATFEVDVVSETLRRTNLGSLDVGDRVNLERAMAAGGRFDGHIVQGHVDGVGTIERTEPEGEGSRVAVAVDDDLSHYVVSKGSVTLDGVSLTVAALMESGFEVAVIPHTLEVTTLGKWRPGDRVNVEVDILAKYVERLLERRSPPAREGEVGE